MTVRRSFIGLPDTTNVTETIGPSSPGTGTSAGSATYILTGSPVKHSGFIRSLTVRANATATFKLKVLSRSGKTVTLVREQSFSVTSGLNPFPGLSIPVERGSIIGFFSATSGFVAFNTPVTVPSGTEYQSSASEVTTSFALPNATAPTQDLRFEMNVQISAEIPAITASGASFKIGPKTPAVGAGLNVGTSSSYFEDWPWPIEGRLTNIDLFANAAGLAQVYVLKPTHAGFTFDRAFPIRFSSGANSLSSASNNIPKDVVIPAEGKIGIWPQTLNSLASQNTRTRLYRTLDTSITDGCCPSAILNAFTASDATAEIQASFTVQPTTALNHSPTNFSYALDTKPPWINFGSAWSVSGSSVTNASSGFNTTQCAYRRAGFYNGTATLSFTLATTATALCVFRGDASSSLGTIAQINTSSRRMDLLNSWDGGTTLPGTNANNKTCSFTFQTGRLYTLSLTKLETTISMTITDTVANVSDTLSFAAQDGTGALLTTSGLCCGAPGWAVCGAGTINATNFAFSPQYTSIDGYFLGDSLTQGSGANTLTDGFSQLSCALLTGHGLVSAHSGNGTSNIMARGEKELWNFLPRFVIFLGGTNDVGTDMTAWKANIDLFAERCDQLGIDKYFGAVPPQQGSSDPEVTMNPYLRSKYNVIGFDRFCTTGGTGLAADLILSLFRADKIHFNQAGHAGAKNQIISDFPGLLV